MAEHNRMHGTQGLVKGRGMTLATLGILILGFSLVALDSRDLGGAPPDDSMEVIWFTMEDFKNNEAAYGQKLQEYRRQVQQNRSDSHAVLEIAARIEQILSRPGVEEWPDWLLLLEDAYCAGDDTTGAVSAIARRYDYLTHEKSGEELSHQALREAVSRSVWRRDAAAVALYETAVERATTDKQRQKAVLDRGHYHRMHGGLDEVVEYFYSVVDEYSRLDPELALTAHLRVAEEYFRFGEEETGLRILDDIEELYRDPSIEERTWETQTHWVKDPDEI